MNADPTIYGRSAPARKALRLSHPWPPLTAEGLERVEKTLLFGCRSCNYQSETATLRQRTISNGNIRVDLQCDNCFTSVSQAMALHTHPAYQTYAEWDQFSRDAWIVQEQARWIEARRERDDLIREEGIKAPAALNKRQQEYGSWLNDVAWRQLAERVKERAGFTCEACLNAPAVAVHHVTYTLGVMPPAWLLRAVCRTCHRQFHADKNEIGQHEWCPKSIPAKQ